ncbi:MAG: ribosomal L7Ae/L30e/S12e/Gadd45 family protein [Clostridia bacterium]|nr:ribosomal L7Ae/L30e/S12e/Gadd45 family protein [Clostridia bacterium]
MYVNIGEGIDVLKVEEKIVGAMGLAKKAGKLITGGEMCEETIRAGKAELTVLCSDMSENSAKKLFAALRNSASPYISLDIGKEELAERLGKKSFVVSCVITDKGFAKIIYKALGITEDEILHESK